MTSPPQQITIDCPSCRKSFETWWRPSINLTLGDMDEDYVKEATIKTCPQCGEKIRLDTLIVGKDGTWIVPVDGDEG